MNNTKNQTTRLLIGAAGWFGSLAILAEYATVLGRTRKFRASYRRIAHPVHLPTTERLGLIPDAASPLEEIQRSLSRAGRPASRFISLRVTIEILWRRRGRSCDPRMFSDNARRKA
jgi:hypothetical protein